MYCERWCQRSSKQHRAPPVPAPWTRKRVKFLSSSIPALNYRQRHRRRLAIRRRLQTASDHMFHAASRIGMYLAAGWDTGEEVAALAEGHRVRIHLGWNFVPGNAIRL